MLTEFFELENKLADQLAALNNREGLLAVKAEFEAEGASLRDLIKLRTLTARQNVPLYLKIGGVEAIRDIKDAMELGVDGLIAPMVESPFGVKKFLGAIDSIFSHRKIFKSINIETLTAVEQIDDILEIARGKVDNITIGRTDLSMSYFNSAIKPDSQFIIDLIDQLCLKVESSKLSLTIGGSITAESVGRLRERQKIFNDRIFSIETRKIVFSTARMLDQENSLAEALRFEETYLRYKLESEAWFSRLEQERLEKLRKRF